MGELHVHKSGTCHGSIARVSMYITKNLELLSRIPSCSESSVDNVKTLMFACSDLWSTGYMDEAVIQQLIQLPTLTSTLYLMAVCTLCYTVALQHDRLSLSIFSSISCWTHNCVRC